MKTNIKARITCLFISKTTIMVNKRETIYFIIFIFDKRLSSFLFLKFYPFSFTYIFFFPYLFRFNFVVSERNVHIIFCRHIWAELSLLFWTFLSGTFFPGVCVCVSGGGGGSARAPSAPPPAYAPVLGTTSFQNMHLPC